MKHSTAAAAVQCVQSGMRVFIHGAAATPFRLIDALVGQADRLRNVEITHIHTMGEAKYADPEFEKSFRVVNYFVGHNMRKKVAPPRVDYLPCFLSEIPQLFRSGRRPLDVAMVSVSPPDQHGFCTLGTSVDVARAAVETAKIIIAQVNPHMPRVHGDGFLHIDDIDHWVEVDDPIPEVLPKPISVEEAAIGKYIAELIPDGACLQMGIGNIPDAALAALKGHRHLGIHTEMWSDGALHLLKSGAVDNTRKKIHPGKTVSGFIMGSKAVYDFINDNPSIVQLDIEYVNRAANIARNPNVAAINSAVEVDLTGQVCADSVGSRIISGVGGQMDFIRGASLSENGKPIIGITSRTKNGRSRLVPALQPGAGVVTTRSHVHYVVTEYGVADLYGRTVSERAQALIGIAHPDDREWLERAWNDVVTNCYSKPLKGGE